MWFKHAENPTLIKGYYGDEDYPRLNNSVLKEFRFIPGGDNMVEIIFDDINFPLKPPKKWIDDGFNTALIAVRMQSVTDFTCNILQNVSTSSVEIQKNAENHFLFSLKSTDNFDLKFSFKWLYIIGIKGYFQNRQ
jgi:hypothetical protein